VGEAAHSLVHHRPQAHAPDSLVFEWDERKAVANRKHGVSFEEAQTVFLDEDALLIPDEAHSDQEERFVLLGLSGNMRTLVVCHCYRQNDEIIRLISARQASSPERRSPSSGGQDEKEL
jgi:uncharacterized DUF497 family protein